MFDLDIGVGAVARSRLGRPNSTLRRLTKGTAHGPKGRNRLEGFTRLGRTLNHEHFFSDGGLTPHLFFHMSFFLEEGLALLRFICQSSGLHQVEKTSRLLQCHKIDKKSGTMNMSSFFSDGGLTPSLFFIFFILSILWASPGGKDLLIFTRGRQGVSKNHRTMLGDSFSGRCWA